MLTRRAFGLTALSGLLAAPAFGLAPLAGSQVPGVFRRKVGDFEITALLDGYISLPAEAFMGIDPAELAAILEASALSAPLATAVNAFVINTPGGTYLLDVGTGTNQAFGPTLGAVAANLAAAGIAPEQIDAVILSHAHTDHVEGLVDAEGAAVYPNAEVVLHENEAGFWLDDGNLSRAPEGMVPLFESARRALAPYAERMRTVTGGEIFAGLTLEAAPGHTPGHSVLHVASGEAELLILADTFHNAAIHTARPDAQFGFDVDGAQAAATRKALFDRAAADGVLIAATHVSFPGLGHIVAEGDRFRYQPAEWVYPL